MSGILTLTLLTPALVAKSVICLTSLILASQSYELHR